MPTTADIPAIESEISGLTTLVHRHWVSTARQGVDDAIAEIETENDRTLETAVVIALILLLLRRRVEAPMPQRTRDRIRRSAETLIEHGKQSAGVGGFARTIATSLGTGHAERGVLELEFMSAARVEGVQLTDRVGVAVRRYVEKRTKTAVALSPALPDVIIENAPDRAASESRAPDSATRDVAAATRNVADRAEDLRTLKDDLNAIVGDTNAALTNAIVDAWAYRQNSIGVFLAAQAAGVRFLIARNPLDDRTTPFCRWVHGKPVSIERAARQVARMREAVEARDRDRMVDAWPMLNLSKKAMTAARADLRQDRAPGARVSDQEIYRRFFLKVGLPPYHWRCRTIVVPG